jgi:hypothetical protein
MSEMAPELSPVDAPEAIDTSDVKSPDSEFDTSRSLHGRTDRILGFVSANPAVRNEAGEIEYYDC